MSDEYDVGYQPVDEVGAGQWRRGLILCGRDSAGRVLRWRWGGKGIGRAS